jgi:hypothetical protein
MPDDIAPPPASPHDAAPQAAREPARPRNAAPPPAREPARRVAAATAAPPNERTRVRRLPDRAAYDRESLERILDEGLVAHVGFAGDDGQPFVIPMAYARQGDRLLLHGSVLSRLMQRAAGGVPVCVTVTLLDGLVLARSVFHHSMNYRSAVVLGRARPIRDRAEKLAALEALVEHLVPGRTADARGPSEKELAATEIVAVPLDEASVKLRTGPPKDDRRDLALDVWAGVVPLHLTAGTPETAPDAQAILPIPPAASRHRRGGKEVRSVGAPPRQP